MINDDGDDVDDGKDCNNNGEDDPREQPVSVPLGDCNEDEDGEDEPKNNEDESGQLHSSGSGDSIVRNALPNSNSICDDLYGTYHNCVDSSCDGS